MPGVAADILTGFLGSGKTSLLKHVLEHGLDGQRVAVVMNELGDIGIDGRVITGLKSVERMVELSSGCICCSIGARFGMAVREILATARPHLVVIETTGVAYPEPLIQQVLDAGLLLDAVITVVDAAAAPGYLAEHEAARRQVEAADFLVVNKTDLAGERELAALERRLRRMNPRAVAHRAQFGAIGSDLCFGTSVGRLRREARARPAGAEDGAHLAADGIEVFDWRGDPAAALLRGRLERLLARLPEEIYRAKGLVRLDGEEGLQLVQFTCGRFEVERFPGPEAEGLANQLVFIGRGAGRQRARIAAALGRCLPGGSRLDRFRAALGGRRA